MKKYLEPEMEIIEFDIADATNDGIATGSGNFGKEIIFDPNPGSGSSTFEFDEWK